MSQNLVTTLKQLLDPEMTTDIRFNKLIVMHLLNVFCLPQNRGLGILQSFTLSSEERFLKTAYGTEMIRFITDRKTEFL